VALRTGRRVVSNIAGLHYDEMRAFLLLKGVAEDAIGSFLPVTKEQIGAAGFWAEDGKTTIVQGGDLVVLDECWRWMAKGQKMPDSMFAFLREHRHFVDARGVSCDVVLITQSITDLDNKVRVVVEKHFVMEKLKRLGLTKQYTVDVYNKWSSTKSNFLRQIVRTYNKEYFKFYSSYEGKGGDEREVDKRINVLRRPIVVIALVCAPLLLFGGVYGTWRMWDKYAHPKPVEVAKNEKAGAATNDLKEVKKVTASTPSGSVAGAPSSGGGAGWRVVGLYSVAGRAVFMVRSGDRVRYVNAPTAYRFNGLNVELFIDDQFVSSYGGSAPGVGGGILGPR